MESTERERKRERERGLVEFFFVVGLKWFGVNEESVKPELRSPDQCSLSETSVLYNVSFFQAMCSLLCLYLCLHLSAR
jgi:hypothetical protein